MSRPKAQQSSGTNSRQHWGKSRGPRSSFRGHGEHSQRSPPSKQSVQQLSECADSSAMSNSFMLQSSEESTCQHQSRSRRQRGPFRGRGKQFQSSSLSKQNVQQFSKPNQVFDWWHEELRTVEANENRERSDSPSSSAFSLSSHGTCDRPRDSKNYAQYGRESSDSRQCHQKAKSFSRYSQFHQLIRLSKMNGNDIAIEISDNRDFKVLLNSKMNKDFVVMTLRILAKLEQVHFTRIVTNILNDTCKSTFLENLEPYLVALPLESRNDITANKFYWEDINKFWDNLHDFFKTIIDLIPTQAHDKLLPILEVTRLYVITSLKTKSNHEIHEDVPSCFKKLYYQLKEKIENNGRIAVDEMPQDFRNLSIIPTVEDLNDHHPYIRPCKIHGAYDSVDHYLDVQFRLLREDFLCPLKNAIQEYKKLSGTNVHTSQISDIRVFEKVKLIGPTVVKNKVGVILFFGVIQNMNWNCSKLFMYGSLLCLTNDNFKSILFATVAERDPRLLEKGKLIIELCVGTQITCDMYNSEYTMVEPKVYFLPYYHTLYSLRHMSEKNFPMKRYIVDAESNPNPPKYINSNTVYIYKGFDIPLLDEKRWPRAKHLKLDEPQYEAFKCALLQELAVIHGPPGTGKTFMALQIVSTLLTNSSSWRNPMCLAPILVVCLTNHALDQFLEGILSHTHSLVRIGEQSRNPNLQEYKLKVVREKYFKDEKKKYRVWQRMTYYQKQLSKILISLSKVYAALRALTSSTCIVSPHVFREYCNNDELTHLTPKDLLTNLFGPHNALLALGLETIVLDSKQSAADVESNPEDGNMDVDDELKLASVIHMNDSEFYCLEISYLDSAIHQCETEMMVNQSQADNAQKSYLGSGLAEKLQQLKSLRTALQTRLIHHPLANDSASWISLEDGGWKMYYHWLITSHEAVRAKIVQLEEEYREVSAQLDDFKRMTDLEVMRNSLVVGLTTTGAARLHESLRALQAPIVLVEEAAEILESHIICSLTEHCQQVILIGDHKQLRPKQATYQLKTNYNMDISLFERIVRMRDKCTQLVFQHRMRPEIAELISPSIYERLENHTSVMSYAAVKGLKKNVFFLDHQNHELATSQNESMSNPYEVKFLLTFAKYLIEQGYKSAEITILTMYSEQLFKFKKAKRSMPILRDVYVTTVDNYQGEENRIVLLSLVRNNHTGNIGFLQAENRVCVALSRAREGLYIMGNMNNLIVNNEIWLKIKKALENNNALGNNLVLQCQIHTDQFTEIRRAADFKNVANGGCNRQCAATLSCGHTCQKPCHITNRDHKDYICKELCLKLCSKGHPCKLLCTVACAPCQDMVSTLLRCGHIVEKPCQRDSSTYPCNQRCGKLLTCGHLCIKYCHIDDDPHHLNYVCREDCKKKVPNCPDSHPCLKKCYELCGVCTTKVLKKRSCGHVHKVDCWQTVKRIICTKLCKRALPCGHMCKQKCYLPCGRCEELVDKIIPDCGHEVKIPCCEKPTSAICKGQCSRMLKCGHPCTARCGEPCTERCEYPRPLPKPALCQHVYPVPCYKIEIGLAEYADKLLQHCPAPCATVLPCGHTCSGSCGSCKQGRIHQPCREKCSKSLICGHKCEALCKDICGPCQKTCSLRCEHNVCTKKCGILCTACREPCTLQCEHFKCKKLCFEMCDQNSCDEPCSKQLKCGHLCIGFCGEPCPPLCRICNEKDLLTFIPSGIKFEARFVFLPECGHCIESNYLDWVWQMSYRIGIKVCPLCKTRIGHCKRYTNQIKRELKNMEIVKQEMSTKLTNLQADKQEILNNIELIEKKYTVHFPGSNAHKELFKSLQTLVSQRNNIGIRLLKDISTKLTLTEIILSKFQETPRSYHTVDNWPVVFNQMIMLMTSLPTTENISHQMLDDVKNELCRLHYMIQLCKFERETGLMNKENALQLQIMYLGLLNLRRFTKSRSDGIYKQLVELKNLLKSSASVDEWKPITIKVLGLEPEDWCKGSDGVIYLMKCEQSQLIPSAPIEEH